MNLKEFEEEKELEYADLKDDEHVLHMWTPLDIEIDKDYQFVCNNIIFKIASNLLYAIAYIIVFIFNKLMYGFKIKGLSNLWAVDGGKVTVSNHIHPMDCTMNGIVNAPKKIYFPTLQSNFEIPVISWIIRLLNAIPIPEKVEAKKEFYNAINELLQNGKTVHFYPETAMRPYDTKLRTFKRGAFRIAVQNNVPIVPIVYTYADVTGVRTLFKEKPFINATVLPAIYPDKTLQEGEAIEKLKNDVHNAMENVIRQNKEYQEI